MPKKDQSLTNRLCRAKVSEDGNIIRAKSFNTNFKGILTKERIQNEVIAWLREKDLISELPIIIYSYYSVYPPGGSFMDKIRGTKSPSTNKHGRKQFTFFIDKDSNIFNLSKYDLHEEDEISVDHLTNQI